MGFIEDFAQSNPFLIKFISIPVCTIITILLFKSIFYFLNKSNIKNSKIIFLTLDSILILFVLIEYIFNKNNLVINSILIFILIYLLINEKLYINKLIELENSYTKIKNLEINNKTLSAKNDELSAFQHDFNNIIQTIGGLLLVGKYDNLKRYYNDLKIDCQTLNDMEKLNSTKIKNPEVLALLVNKYELAKQYGIRMNLDIYSDLSKLNTDIFQIIRILGILLDNAIEATKECNEKILNIEFRIENNTQTIIIENSYSNKNINTENIYQKGFSTKKGNQGLGLWKVNKIIKNHKNFNLYTYRNSEIFTQKLEILL